MATYAFRAEPVLFHNARRADPQKIGEALEEIAAANDQRLTPPLMVAAARDRRNYLHRHFEWNNQKAAEAHRLNQARQIVHCLRVVDDDAPAMPQIAFLSVAPGDGAGFTYASREAVKGSAFFQRLVLERAEKDLESWERRYSELAEICTEIRRLRGSISARRAALLSEHERPTPS
jgi:hypothetical protein